MIGVVAGQEGGGVSCVYPLNDNGTVAASFGNMTAGPAIGDGQTMGYAADGGNHVHLLLSAGALTTARFSRGAAPIGYEAAEVTNTGGVIAVLSASSSPMQAAQW